MFGMGAAELMIILVIVLLLFGASKLPELGRSLGSGLSNFKKGLKDGDDGPTAEQSPRAVLPRETEAARRPPGATATDPEEPSTEQRRDV